MTVPRGRRRRGPTVIVGLTGGIGMGKSTAARIMRREGVPVFDADGEVHRLGRPGGAAVGPVGRLVPAAVVDGAVDRDRLRAAVRDDPLLLASLEAVIHPLVRRARDRTIAAARRLHAPILVLDVPLLFETGGDRVCDVTIVVSAPAAVQRARVRQRRRMSADEAARLIERQMPDREKRRRARFVVPTGLSRFESARRIRLLFRRFRDDPVFIKASSQMGAGPRQLPPRNARFIRDRANPSPWWMRTCP